VHTLGGKACGISSSPLCAGQIFHGSESITYVYWLPCNSIAPFHASRAGHMRPSLSSLHRLHFTQTTKGTQACLVLLFSITPIHAFPGGHNRFCMPTSHCAANGRSLRNARLCEITCDIIPRVSEFHGKSEPGQYQPELLLGP